MAPNADPWRTLGLSPGATQDEIRRAYRRLAKVNHPDAAGESALPRFLAIQAAYDNNQGINLQHDHDNSAGVSYGSAAGTTVLGNFTVPYDRTGRFSTVVGNTR